MDHRERIALSGMLDILRRAGPLINWERVECMYRAGERTFWRLNGHNADDVTCKTLLATQQGSRTMQLSFSAEVGADYAEVDIEALVDHVAITPALPNPAVLQAKPAGN